MAKIRATQSLDIFIKIMNWIAKKLKKEEPQNSIHRIQINKVDCCENCGNKDYFVSEHFEIECEVALNKYSAQLCADWDETRTRMLKGDGKWFREERRKADGNRTQ